MTEHTPDLLKLQLDQNGFVTLRGVFTAEEVAMLTQRIDSVTQAGVSLEGESIQSRNGNVVAARNLVDLITDSPEIWQRPGVLSFLKGVLGPGFGLVRVLYFDKPPGRSWALPWHRDRTIAVKHHAGRSRYLSKPTTKAGVPHMEADAEILQSMLTLRIHLDPVSDENGPLKVLPGSHQHCDPAEATADVATTVYADAGDVFAMRPLLCHCSGESAPGTSRHRRVLHLEFAANERLPDSFQWRWFVPPEKLTSQAIG